MKFGVALLGLVLSVSGALAQDAAKPNTTVTLTEIQGRNF